MHILIFKTNIQNESQKQELGSLLDLQQTIIDWNIDMEDIDRVLRIESELNNCKELISTINKAGFTCEELPD